MESSGQILKYQQEEKSSVEQQKNNKMIMMIIIDQLPPQPLPLPPKPKPIIIPPFFRLCLVTYSIVCLLDIAGANKTIINLI